MIERLGMKTVVFGSINMDLVVRTPRFPLPGETLTGHAFYTNPGGKGANQAVASARLGNNTQMVGRVGRDGFGAELLSALERSGVETTQVWRDPISSSGTALITIDDTGENQIIIIPGANGAVGDEDIARLESVLEGTRALLLQLEIPLPAVIQAASLAWERGITVILDPAPIPPEPLPYALLSHVNIITPNEVEAAAIVNTPVRGPEDALLAAKLLHRSGVQQVIIKMGKQGAFWSDGNQATLQPAFHVDAIDTVAAGDAFNGALAAALTANLEIEEAITWAAAAGALATTKEGAQGAMPDRKALFELLNRDSAVVR